MAVTRLDKVAGIHLESGKYSSDLLNGNVALLGALEAGETELYNMAVATTDEELTNDEFLFHATPEVDADPRNAGLKNFSVKAGEAGRFYHLQVGDIVTITDDLVEGTTAVGEFVVPQLGSVKLSASTDGTTADVAGTGTVSPRLQFRVEQKTTLGFDAESATVLRVVKS